MTPRPSLFDDWIRDEISRIGAFTALIVLVKIEDHTVRPLRSSHVHVMGSDLIWSDMAQLFDKAGADWDGVLFSVRTDPDDNGPIADSAAKIALKDHVQSLIEDRTLLNAGHFFDRKGRRLRVDEVAAQ
ncbi:hypothetical protein [Phaeovulum sp.]|uniref:hypothetical protein n=1 Tax=Phaeovulum sp. TaxID=2934796 RepID=UPI0039E42FD8